MFDISYIPGLGTLVSVPLNTRRLPRYMEPPRHAKPSRWRTFKHLILFVRRNETNRKEVSAILKRDAHI